MGMGTPTIPRRGLTLSLLRLRRWEAGKEMIGVDKIDDIRRLGRGGASVASISRDTGVSEPTVRKCLRETDPSERPPAVGRVPESPLLEPFAELVDSWLLEDRRCWHKQRHTARRVFDRLVAEKGFEGSYSTVRRYVRRRREELAAELDAREAQGFLLLDWLPGECQVDFGRADFRVRGVITRGHFLVVTLPHSNVGLAQVFWGETAECVCQGLRDVLEFLGGVPLRAVFDNAAEVGRRVGAEMRASALFRRFAAHHGLDHGLANPCSGNERGSVENEAGTLGRSLFVPVPQAWDVRAYNERLLGTCPALSDGRPHYRRGAPESELFGDDRAALSPLPAAPFACVAWLTRRCDKQGSFGAGGEHRYSAGPANASREVAVATGAFDVTVVGAGGEVVAEHPREWGDASVEYGEPVDLAGYDRAFELLEGAPPVPRIPDAEREEFSSRARSLLVSKATIAWLLETATPGQLAACSGMLARELESRERSKRARPLRQARFPAPKAVEGFDWSNVRFPEGWGRDEMLSLDFAERAEGLVFHGPTGRDKTHVATALGIEATRRGVPVRFFRTATLVPQLGKAKREGTLDRLLADVGRAELVILDEFGHVPSTSTARACPARSYPTRTRGGTWCPPRTSSPAGGARSSRTTSSPPRSWTASSTTAGSSSSATQATASLMLGKSGS